MSGDSSGDPELTKGAGSLTPQRGSEENDSADSTEEDGRPPIPRLLDQKTPEPIRSALEMMMYSGPLPNPISKKITSEHIDKVIDQAEKDSERAFQDRGFRRRYMLAGLVLGAGLIVFLVTYLADRNSDLMEKVLVAIGSLVMGFFGGMGYQKSSLSGED